MTPSEAPKTFSGHIVRPWSTNCARPRGSTSDGHLEKRLFADDISVRQKNIELVSQKSLFCFKPVLILRVACFLCVSVCACLCVTTVYPFKTPPCEHSKLSPCMPVFLPLSLCLSTDSFSERRTTQIAHHFDSKVFSCGNCVIISLTMELYHQIFCYINNCFLVQCLHLA